MSTRSQRTLIPILLLALAALVLPATASASRSLYVASGDDGPNAQALAFSLDAAGTPAPIQTITGANGGYFNGISMTPDAKFMFMADYDDGSVAAYAVTGDGTVTPAPGSPFEIAPGSRPYGTAVTPDGKFLIAGDYDRSTIEVLAIGADGSLSTVPGGSANVGFAPYMVAASVDSRVVYVPDHANDRVQAFQVGVDGALTPLPGSPFPAGDEPYMASVTPDGKHLYVVNYGSPDSVSAYSIAEDGSLTAVSGSPFPTGHNPYGGIAITPDGRTLYISGSDRIDVATINADGSLTAGAPILVSNYNPGLAVSPDGTRLYNAVDTVNRLDTYSIGEGGALTQFGDPVALPTTLSLDIQSIVVAPDQPPVAALTATSGKDNLVTFDATSSSDSDGSIASYVWDFGDGQTETTNAPTATHTYAASGSYSATVTLTDNAGCSTALVFTGQTAYCNGSGVARAAAAVSADGAVTGARVSAKKSQKQKGQLQIVVKAGADEAANLVATGSAKFKGVKGKVALKKARGASAAGATKTLKLKAKSKRKGRAVVGSKGKAVIAVRLTDALGNTTTENAKVKLK